MEPAEEGRRRRAGDALELVDELFERQRPVVVLDRRCSELEVVKVGNALGLVALQRRARWWKEEGQERNAAGRDGEDGVLTL